MNCGLQVADCRFNKGTFGFFFKLVLLFLFLGCQSSYTQSVSATLKADSNHIMIGDALNVHFTLRHSKNLPVIMPVVADTIGNMDVISASKVDTAFEGNDRILSQTYTVSAYDSGVYYAGPVSVIFKEPSGVIDTILSNNVPVAVSTLPIDTAKPFKAIKAPLDVPYSWKEYVPYILGAFILLMVIAGISYYIWYVRKRRKPLVVERPKPKDPAHIWARKELKKLEDEKLWQQDDIKLYYSRLTDILRLYLEYRYNWLALESTTEEIEEAIDKYNLKNKAKDYLLQILRESDLVKFAKMKPMPDINIKAMGDAYKFIDFTEPSEEKEEEKK